MGTRWSRGLVTSAKAVRKFLQEAGAGTRIQWSTQDVSQHHALNWWNYWWTFKEVPCDNDYKKTKQNKQKDSSQNLSLFFNFTFVRKMNQLTNSTPYIYCAFISSKQPRKHIFLQEHLPKMGISCEERQLKGKIKFVSNSYVKSHINPTSHKSTQQALFYTSKCKIIQSLSAASTAKYATTRCYLGIHQRRKAPGKKGSMHRSEQKWSFPIADILMTH